MTHSYFEQGFTVPDYMQELRNYRSLVRRLVDEAQVELGHAEMLRKSTAAWSQPVIATAHTEDWCGDWACNLPILHSLFSEAEIAFRIHRGSEHPQLKERYAQEGEHHIPVISLWDGDGREQVRWVEAPDRVQEMKQHWKRENPELMRLYEQKDHDKQAAKEFARIYRLFLEEMARWYREGMWSETSREIVEKAAGSA